MNPHVPTPSFSQEQLVASIAASPPLPALPPPQSILEKILDLRLVHLQMYH